MQSMQFTVPYNLHQALKFIKHKSKQGMGKVVLATSYFVSFHTKTPIILLLNAQKLLHWIKLMMHQIP